MAVSMRYQETHWAEFTYGLPSRKAALAAGRTVCETRDRDYLVDCPVGVLRDEAGKQIDLEEAEWVGCSSRKTFNIALLENSK